MSAFSISNRWVHLFESDMARTMRSTWAVAAVSLLAFTGIYIVSYLLSDAGMAPVDRNVVVFIISFLYAAYIPIGAFPHINGSRNDVVHILLPVNRYMKFLSVLFAGSIAVPAAFMMLLYSLDWLICVQSAGGEPAFRTCLHALKTFSDIFMAQSVFVLGNILFRKHKVGLSLLFILVYLGGLMLFDNAVFKYILPALFYILAFDRFVNMEL